MLDAPPPISAGDLIDQIEGRYHAVHRDELPALLSLARRVEAQHASHPDVPRGLTDHLERMARDLEHHMMKEEQGLFPMLRGAEGNPAFAIELMRDEHEEHAVHLRRLAALTHDYQPPAGASPEWRALYAAAAKFASDLEAHIYAENNELFPRFEH